MRIAIVSAAADRHARQLAAAFGQRNVDTVAMRLSDILFDTGARHGLILPQFGEELPDAVCLRTMDGGTFEGVTRRLAVLHALRAMGVLVSNDARAVEICTDKSATSFRLAAAGIPTPRSHAVETRHAAAAILRAAPCPLVLKPLFGAQGKGIRLIRHVEDLPEAEDVGGVYYLQELVDTRRDGAWQDYRLMVSRGRVVAAMMRRSASSFVTNIKQGAAALPTGRDAVLEQLAVAAAQAVGADFCGIDLIRAADGTPFVIEVNSMPAWTGLEEATGLDIAAIRAGDLLAQLDRPIRRAG